MPDATGFLIEIADSDGETRYDHIADREKAIEYLRQLVGQGKTAILYQRVPFEVQIGVTVKSPRRRRKKEAKEGAAGPDANRTPHSEKPLSDKAADRPVPNPASPVFPWTCEANFDGDPKCPGPVMWDHVTCGYFCGLHLTAIPPSGRVELHRKHAARNRPVRVAHAG